MPLVLSSAPGKAVVMTGLYSELAVPPPKLFTLSESLNPEVTGMVVQGMGLAHDVDVQVQNTIGPDVYLYTFADGVGSFELAVACPLAACSARGGTQSGLAGILAYYNANRLSRRENPIEVVLAPDSNSPFAMPCFLRGIRVNTQDPETNLATASLSFIHAGFVGSGAGRAAGRVGVPI